MALRAFLDEAGVAAHHDTLAAQGFRSVRELVERCLTEKDLEMLGLKMRSRKLLLLAIKRERANPSAPAMADEAGAAAQASAAAATAAPPPQAAAATAPLPFLGDDIFVLIAAGLDARMLGRLACAAQRFWRPSVPDPAHTAEDVGAPELWSVPEEAARRRLAAQSEQVRGWVPRGGVGGSWLRALGEAEKLQRPLRFTAHHAHVALGEDGTLASKQGGGLRGAVCGAHEMRHGRHYATFTIRTLVEPFGVAALGVVGEGFNPAFPLQASPQGWALRAPGGTLCHAGGMSRWGEIVEHGGIKEGDVVGLLLDLDAATLTVWLNGERKGVAVGPGPMANMLGRQHASGRLEGPLRWAVDLNIASVAIATRLFP